jgi:hypothetical protein
VVDGLGTCSSCTTAAASVGIGGGELVERRKAELSTVHTSLANPSFTG